MEIKMNRFQFAKPNGQRRTLRSFMLGVIFFALGVFSARLWPTHVHPPNTDIVSGEIASPIRLGQNGLINPLLEYATADNQYSEIISLSNDLNGRAMTEIENGKVSDIGVFFQDLNSGRWAGVNQNERFSPASLLKVPVMMTYLKLAEAQPAILNKSVVYDGSFDDNALEDFKPLKALQIGYSYTVSDLLRFMIGYSDNNADELLYTMGMTNDEFDKTFTDIGLPVPTSTNDFLSPRLYSRFFRVLYNQTYLDQEMSQKGLGLLALADFPQGLTAGVPEEITVAQKFGEHEFQDGTEELHDCGIVYRPQHPYVLCVMTKGNDFEALTSAIRNVSQSVWSKDQNLLR